MPGVFGGNDTQQVKSTSEPWGPQADRYKTSLNRLDQLFGSGALRINPYPGQTVAPTSPETAKSWGMIAQRAQAGSPLNRASQSYLMRVLDPSYATGESSGINSVLDSAANDVAARFSQAGRTFSGAHANSLNASQGQIRYQDYARRAAEQMQAAQFAPQLAREDYFDANQLGQVGSQREAQMQDEINAQINKYNQYQNMPINELALYQNAIGGNLGGTTTGTQPVNNGNPWGQIFGTALQSLPFWFGA